MDRPRINLIMPSGGAPLLGGDWPDASGSCPVCGPGPDRPFSVCLQCHRGDPLAEADLAARRRRALLGSVGRPTPDAAREADRSRDRVFADLDSFFRRHHGKLSQSLICRVAVGSPDLGGSRRFDWSGVPCPAQVGRVWLVSRGVV